MRKVTAVTAETSSHRGTNMAVPKNTTAPTTPSEVPNVFDDYDDLVDIRTVKLREGASRVENAKFFLEQIKNPHKFRVGKYVVEICCIGTESLSDVLVKHFNRSRR